MNNLHANNSTQFAQVVQVLADLAAELRINTKSVCLGTP